MSKTPIPGPLALGYASHFGLVISRSRTRGARRGGEGPEFVKLPNADRATVAQSKVVGYLLSADHPDGRSKAMFFSDFGFRAQQWGVFAEPLLDHGSAGEVTSVARSDYGTRYSVDGAIKTPDGRNPRTRTVWITDFEHAAPCLITAHPLRKHHV